LFLLVFAPHNFLVGAAIDPSQTLDKLEKLAQDARDLGLVVAQVDGPCNVC